MVSVRRCWQVFRVWNDSLKEGRGCLFQVCCDLYHHTQVMSTKLCPFVKREYMNRIKNKNKITSIPGMMYFLTWWMNCEPGSSSVISNYITRSNKRYPLFLKNAIAFVYFGVGRTYWLRIDMLCKGSIAFISYLMVFDGCKYQFTIIT